VVQFAPLRVCQLVPNWLQEGVPQEGVGVNSQVRALSEQPGLEASSDRQSLVASSGGLYGTPGSGRDLGEVIRLRLPGRIETTVERLVYDPELVMAHLLAAGREERRHIVGWQAREESRVAQGPII
jgi:hypothetical protein